MSDEVVIYDDAGRVFMKVSKFVFDENQNPALAKHIRENLKEAIEGYAYPQRWILGVGTDE